MASAALFALLGSSLSSCYYNDYNRRPHYNNHHEHYRHYGHDRPYGRY